MTTDKLNKLRERQMSLDRTAGVRVTTTCNQFQDIPLGSN